MPTISQTTKKLIQQYQDWHQSFLERKESVPTIHVDEVASRVAEFYEKLREIIDWKEEHLMKRAAIARNLKRRLFLAKEGKVIAEPLILELIRGGHFPNDQIEETKIGDVEKILDKYIYILENSDSGSRTIAKGKEESLLSSPSSEKQKLQLYNWLLGIAACEIEETLSTSLKERALIDFMTESMAGKIKLQQRGIISIGGITEEEKNRQIYIAVQRALFKLDPPIISYHLLKKRYDQWVDLPNAKLQEITQNIYSIWESLEKELNHPLKDKFYKICERYDTPYLLLGDILSEENQAKIYEKISKPEDLEKLIKGAYHRRLSTLKKRLFRAATYSTLSIFLGNSVVLFLLEVPLAKMIMGTFTPIAIAIDILGPTFLMFLLVTTIKPPSKSNLEIVLLETMKIVYETERTDLYEIKVHKKRNFLVKFFIVLLYLIGALIPLAAITIILKWAGLPPTSFVINIMFVALIAFAGLAIRNKSEELTIEEKETRFFGFIFDILFLPIVGLGHWLTNKWKKYNAIAVFFSALVDLPFQTFIEFLEQWRYFLKEKKEKIH